MAHNYPKITSPFKRTDAKSKTVNVDVWFDDYAKFFGENGLPFYATEKVDGTNLNIVYDGNHIQYTGHTDKTVWDPEVEEWIKSKFQTPEFEQICEQLFGEHEIKLCGELIGPKIQSNFYKLEDYKFILFDIHNNTTNAWWSREKVEQIAKELNLDIVPVIGETTDTLRGWVNYLHNYKFISKFNNDVEIEGFVVRPLMEILKANGERVIYKIKINDILGRFRYMNI
jgi:ATP-dependent RNA circularization protein (DNA/RNA ligase family)